MIDKIACTDALEFLRGLPDNSIDSCVTDPPYGLSKEPNITEVLTHWLNGDHYEHKGNGFMGKSWDSFVPGPEIWKEVYRVLKPGAFILVFTGTRTADLTGIALRLAGFEIHPCIGWVHAQALAKGANLSKRLDKRAGAKREIVGKSTRGSGAVRIKLDNHAPGDTGLGTWDGEHKEFDITAPSTPEAKQWDGWYYGKQALKPVLEIILMAQKSYDGKPVESILKWGVGALNIDRCRIGYEEGGTVASNPLLRKERGCKMGVGPDKNGSSCSLKPDGGEVTVNPKGRFPANFLLSHIEDCVRKGTKKVKPTGVWNRTDGMRPFNNDGEPTDYKQWRGVTDPDGLEEVEDWGCSPDCPVRQLNEQAGKRPSASETYGSKGGHTAMWGNLKEAPGYLPLGTSNNDVSRYFYSSKASTKERWFLCKTCDKVFPGKERKKHLEKKHDIVSHPTQKPQKLIEYLIRLVTPLDGVVLDPFMGSGTTAVAAIKEGFHYTGCDLGAGYCRIAEARIKHACEEKAQQEEEHQAPLLV